MTQFIATEKETPAAPPVPSNPTAAAANFSYSSDGGDALSRTFKYAHRQHDLRTMLREGYFDGIAHDFQLRPWDEIHVTAGPDPADAIRAILRVIRVPTSNRRLRMERLSNPGIEPHLRVALVARWKPTAVLHDGTAEEADAKPSPNRKAA